MRGVAQPKLAEHKDVRAAGDGGAVVIVSLPRGEEPEDGIVVVVAKNAGTMVAQCGHPQPRRSARDRQGAAEDVRLLRHVDLRLKLDDLLDLLARGSLAGLLVTHDGADRLRLQGRLAGVAS